MSNPVSEWWSSAPGPRKLAVAAIGVVFVSQFLMYSEPHTWGTLSIDADFNTEGRYYSDFAPSGTGWELHPWAPWILILTAIFHVTDLADEGCMKRFGYWITLVGLFFAVSPAQATQPGGKLGLLGLLAVLVAAIWNAFTRKKVEPKSTDIPFQP